MKNCPKTLNSSSGSVLIIALVVTTLATMGILAGAIIIGARGDLSEAEFTGLDRRIRQRNSQVLAKEVIYQKHLFTDALQTTQSVTYSLGDWGDVKIGTIDTPPLSYNASARTHPTGAVPLRAFSKDVSVEVQNGSVFVPMQYQLRSYNPALGGDLLSVHPTNETTDESVRITGDLKVKGRAVFWPGVNYQTTHTFGVRAENFIVPANQPPLLLFENPLGDSVKPSNYVQFPQTVGITETNAPYGGFLNLVNNTTSGTNSYFQRIDALFDQTSIDGNSASTDGSGPSTAAVTANDSTLIAAINDPNLPETTLVSQLAVSSPLSSNVIKALLLRNPPVSDPYLLPLLNSQAPLPDDVLTHTVYHQAVLSTNLVTNILTNTGFGYICDGHGTLLVNLSSPYLPNVAAVNIDQVFLRGQYNETDADLAKTAQPRVIAIHNSPNVKLSEIYLQGTTNQRRFVLALSQTSVLDNSDLIDATGVPLTTDNITRFVFVSPSPYVNWRMITEMEGISSEWDINGVSTATLTGGIRTDFSININNGTLFLEKEADPEALESMLSRNAWIETYR